MQPIRIAVRRLMRAPAFAIAATLTLALGIGMSTAVYTVADLLLVRKLPVRDQAGLVLLWGETPDGAFANWPLALKDVRAFTRDVRSLQSVAFFGFRGATATPIVDDGRAFQLRTSLVSGNFFDVLGSQPLLGRTFRPEDDVAGAEPVFVLSHRGWHRQFGGDSGIVGKSITMARTGRSYVVVGVMPPGLDYPGGTDVWAPVIAYGSAAGILDVVTGELDILARLKPGATASQASAELTNFFALLDAPAWRREMRGAVHPFADVMLGNSKPAATIVTLATTLLLLIACGNVANLLLVREAGRIREFALRSTLGASRGRIVAQLLGEGAVLAVAAGLLGIGLAVGGVKAFVALAPVNTPRLEEIGVNSNALIAAFVITTLTTLGSTLGPAVFASRVRPEAFLRSGSRATTSRRLRMTTEALVVAQIALAVTSLAAAALVGKSFVRLRGAELSFDADRLVVGQLAIRQDLLKDGPAQLAALEAVLTNVGALPGVREVSPVLAVPFVGSGGGIDGRLSRPGQGPDESARNPIVNMEVAASNYFSMLGVPVLRGRTFTDTDRAGATPVIVVSATVASHYWPGEDAVGKRLDRYTVVGVVPDTRYRELRTPRATVYFPLQQSPFGSLVPSTLLIRTAGAASDIVPSLSAAVTAAHVGVTLVRTSPLEALLDGQRAQPRLNAAILALFGMAAVSLATIGLVGAMATLVRQRSLELGIRLALGATARDVVALVMARGFAVAVVGAIIGLAGALAINRLLTVLLFEVSPTDAGTLGSVAATMVIIAVIASTVPARLAGRIDPNVLLRREH